ncbi:nuclear pore glycoprotein p62-like isoform X2 [Physella acuta]|uniref:nuclear pore glycoprotein p62-like isoform X2 n=1 Tax=Physella acuta TaxID=109671 RepID=UPI0027DAEC3D|nr:nuclear pore glycoprotein p62-like isoform X2 [Physella acuta]
MLGAPTTTAGSTGFTFGSSTSGGGFSFGAGSGGTAGGFGGFGLSGAAATSAPTAATTGFNFGAAATKPPTSATGFGFTLGTQQPTLGTQQSTLGTQQPSLGTQQPALGTQQPAQVSQPSSTGFGFSLGLTQPSQPSQPATGFSFGQVSAAGGGDTTATNTATAGTIGFGIKPPASTTQSGFTGFGAATTTSGVGTGSLLGGLLSAPTTTTTSTAPASTTSAPSGFSFGGSITAPASTASTVGGFGFGSTTTQQSLTTSSLGGGNVSSTFGVPSSSSAVTSTLATSTVTTIGAPAVGQKQMTFRQLEETINKWTTELEEQEKYFLEQATQVNAWDRIVMDNGEKIIQLNKDVEKVKLDQQKLDHELDFVHSQQKELEDILVPLEKALDSMPAISYQQHADVEREHTYMLAESLDAQLKRMGQDLKEIIERLNSSNSKPDPNDPVQQITKILNAHVVSLMWIDRNSANLQKQVDDITKQMEREKREQEKNFRLAYS